MYLLTDVKLLQEPDRLPLFSLVNCKHCRVQSCSEALMTALDVMVWCGNVRKAFYDQLWFVLAPDLMQ